MDAVSTFGGQRDKDYDGNCRPGTGGELILDKLEPLAVSAAEAARLLGVSKPKIYELASRADFHGAFKFGQRTLFSVEALRDWIRLQTEASSIG